MEKTDISKISSSTKEEALKDEFEEMLLTLPKERNWDGTSLYLFQGFWCPSIALKAIISFQKHFQAHDDDIILASTPKSGTTWLKALTHMIVNRKQSKLGDSPLLTLGAHELVPFVEFDLYLKNQSPNLENRPQPRIFSTHAPYESLPPSIKDSNCKIVYICRNPMDQLISHWHFTLKLRREGVEPLPLEQAVEMYCRGVHSFGPFWNHVLGFWKVSLENPKKVLFLKYEDLKEDVISHTKRLAEFLGFPITVEEEKEGIIEEISRLCSFETMKELEVNKNGRRPSGAPNSAFFRKAEVGDWENYFTPSMAEHMEKLMQEKLGESGLTFNLSRQVQKDACA